MPIIWKEDFSIGIKEIDDQHRHFIDLMNETYDAFYKMEVKEKLGELIDKIIQHADLHFATEERYFTQFNYEFTEEHKVEHTKLKMEVSILKSRFVTEEGIKVVGDLLGFLEKWLTDHIVVHDRKYAEDFHRRGLI